MLLLPLSDAVIMKTLQSFSILHNIEPLYSSPSDRERERNKQFTINTKIQSICKIIKQSVVCSLQKNCK